jgi:hypothetical protein
MRHYRQEHILGSNCLLFNPASPPPENHLQKLIQIKPATNLSIMVPPGYGFSSPEFKSSARTILAKFFHL